MEKAQMTLDMHPALETISRYMLRDGYQIVADFRKSFGCRLFDANSGRYYLDFFSCFATMPLGYNHPALTTGESIEQLGRAAVQKPSNSDLYSEEMAGFVAKLGQLGMVDCFKYMFFIEGGALAVENALKVAFDWKVRKNLAAGKGIRGHRVIHFREAFHGRSGYTLSLTNTADPRKTQYFPKFDWPRVLNPKCRFPLEGDNLDQVIEAEKESVTQIQEAIAMHGDDIACLIIEPIQSEGGDHHFRPEFHQKLRQICDENDMLFIYDEVQTGFGATGKMWAFEHFTKPDIIAFGKKSQVCGILVGNRIDEIPDHVFRVSSRINSTWGGNLVDMVRCRMYLEIFERERILENVQSVGVHLLSQLQSLQQEFPHLVSNARGLGLHCSIDLPSTELRSEARKRLFNKNLIMLGCGHRSLRFRTALNITEAEIDEGIAILRETLTELTG